jgi:hypothetical protein
MARRRVEDLRGLSDGRDAPRRRVRHVRRRPSAAKGFLFSQPWKMKRNRQNSRRARSVPA